MGAQIWEVLVTVSTDAIAQSSFGEIWQVCAEIWIFKAVFPVTSTGLNRTETALLGKTKEWWPEWAPVFFSLGGMEKQRAEEKQDTATFC